MKHFAELTTSERINPCIEYPGRWFVNYHPAPGAAGEPFDAEFATLEEAMAKARTSGEVPAYSISWCASDDDPRVGQVWFSGFYIHGRFNAAGKYTGFWKSDYQI